MRIAVSPSIQNMNVGSKLIKFIESKARINNISFLSSSFSLDSKVVNFWFKQDFNCYRISVSKDSSSGNHSSDFIKLVSNINEDKNILKSVVKLFNSSFLYRLTNTYKDLDHATITNLISKQNNLLNLLVKTIEFRVAEVIRYSEKQRSLEMINLELLGFLLSSWNSLNESSKFKRKTRNIIIAKLLLQKSWKEIVKEFNLDGKKEAQQIIREATKQLLVNCN